MAEEQKLTGLARRERTGSQKRQVGIKNIARMLPQSANYKYAGEAPPNIFAPDLAMMGMEDSYCDMWDRTEVIDARTRSLFNVSLMTGVGNVGNQYELGWHAPGAIHNGVKIEELEAIVVHARAYVGSPASAWAMTSIVTTLREQGLLPTTFPGPDMARREKTGSEKRAIAKEVLRQIEPDSPLLQIGEEMDETTFAAELDYMVLENCYFDLWTRDDVLSKRDRSVVTLGLLMGLGNHDALAQHVPVAQRNGLSILELAEFVYQAATYLGFPSGLSLRATMAKALKAGK